MVQNCAVSFPNDFHGLKIEPVETVPVHFVGNTGFPFSVPITNGLKIEAVKFL